MATQVQSRMDRELRQHLRQMGQLHGQAPDAQAPAVSFSVRPLGQPARSGSWQAIFTFYSLDHAQSAFGQAWNWVFPVDEAIDPSGQRRARVKWYDPTRNTRRA